MDSNETQVPASENEVPGAQRYTLMAPIVVGGGYQRHVHLRPCLQRDIDDWGSGELASIRAFICRLTGLEPEQFRDLQWPDSEMLHKMFRNVVPDFVLAGGD